MLENLFTSASAAAINLVLCTPKILEDLLNSKPEWVQTWIQQHQFTAAPGQLLSIPSENGQIKEVLYGSDESTGQFAKIAQQLPQGIYKVVDWRDLDKQQACLAWALSSYQFTHYKEHDSTPKAQLVWPEFVDQQWVNVAYEAIALVRDLINMPANALTPAKLAEIASNVATENGARCTIVTGETLEKEFPAIHTVGQAAAVAPRLIDIRWSHPNPLKTVTIVGKGVCFDSGGLDIKPSAAMLTMKKDMGGAAHALALACMIMKLNLPFHLRLLIPAVENAISSNAMHPLDIIRTRKGLTVEVGNTDAEGRLILADALYEACQDNPNLIIDFATLTGAARIALGTELPALFSNNLDIANKLLSCANQINDPLWLMPLHRPYEKHLKSSVADLSSTGKSSYGGAITAALFLEKFITPPINWLHIDHMAWNLASAPGKPEGGEAMGLLAVFEFLSKEFTLTIF